MPHRLTLVLVGTIATIAFGDVVEEKGIDGKVRAKYTVKDGERNGSFTEYYANGALRRKGNYKADKLDGAATVYFPNGRTLATMSFAAGELNGSYTGHDSHGGTVVAIDFKAGKPTVLRIGTGKGSTLDFKDGEPALPRCYDEIVGALAAINTIVPPIPKKADVDSLAGQAALRRLQSYRAVAGVPFESMEIDSTMAAKAAAGAKLCEAIGRLDHKPMNPGWPEDKFQLAFEGTSHSNLCVGQKDLAATVDSYMDDSDGTNIDRVGHRRWCLNPSMLKTGFGRSGKYSAMWSMDNSREDVPAWEHFSWPPAGLVPADYVKPNVAWHVTLSPKKYATPATTDLKVTVTHQTDRSPDKAGDTIKVTNYTVHGGSFGSGPAVIFKPNDVKPAPGSRYWVTIDGLKKTDGTAVTLKYMIVFVSGL